MSAESFHQMLDAFATGLGLCLLGAANAFLRRSSVALRATLSVSIIGLMTGLVFELGEAGGARSVALVLSAVYSCLRKGLPVVLHSS